jgi:toxin-antitoxin system PIN domain toxin
MSGGAVIAVDTNVLVHGHRAGTTAHGRAVQWLRHLAEGERRWGIPVFCLAEFVRVVTHTKIFSPPSTLEQALSALQVLMASPSLVVLTPGERFPPLLFDLIREADARGNMAFDAQIAAVCLETGADQLLTTDRDFTRFPAVRIISLQDEFV